MSLTINSNFLDKPACQPIQPWKLDFSASQDVNRRAYTLLKLLLPTSSGSRTKETSVVNITWHC
jgi:hypothetical protein